MATRRNRLADADRIARDIQTALGRDIKSSRLAAGTSQSVAGRSVRMSHAQFGRIERGVLANVTIRQLSRACSAVGLKLVVRAYPDGDPVRDRAHLALIDRFRARIPPELRVRTEVPVTVAPDQRAWDVVVSQPNGSTLAVEAETRLHDLQSLERRVALKARDGGMDRALLLVNDTAANRRVLALHRESLRGRFPLDGREVLRALDSGALPAGGILLL